MRPSSSRKPTSVKNLDKQKHRDFEKPITKPRLASIRSRGQTPNKFSNIDNISLGRKRMSTRLAFESPEQTFMEQFCREVSKQKKEIHKITNKTHKENTQSHVFDYDKALQSVKTKGQTHQMDFGLTSFDRQHQALQKLINRNQQALKSFVQNRKQLIQMYYAKQLN